MSHYDSNHLAFDRYTEYFNAYENSSSSELLRNVLSMEFHDTNDNLTDSDFEEHIYVETPNVKKTYFRLLNNIRSKKRFHAIHGYGKNGKSTFLQYFQHKIISSEKENHEFMLFDFEADKFDHEGQVLIQKSIVDFLREKIEEFESLEEACKTVIGFIDFYNTTHPRNSGKVKKSFKSLINVRKRFFETIADDLFYPCKKYLHDLKNGHEEPARKEFWKKFKKRFNEKNLRHDDGKIICFLIGLFIYEQRGIFEGNPKKGRHRSKVIFIFDNLDEVFSTTPKSIAQKYIFDIAHFLKVFEKGAIKSGLPGFSMLDMAFLFSLRSANLVNSYTLFTRKPASSFAEKGGFEIMNNFELYKIGSVKESQEILGKRLSFYRKICDHVGKVKQGHYATFLDAFISSTKRSSNNTKFDLELSNISRLWNGNREFFHHIDTDVRVISLNDKIERLGDHGVYISKGAFLNYFFDQFINHSQNNSLASLFNYFFRSGQEEIGRKRCNLKRLLLNIVISECKEFENRRVDNFKDLDVKGASLLDVLETLDKLNTNDLGDNYDIEEIKMLFRRIFHNRIDAWGHVLTCTKEAELQELRDNSHGSYINLDSEVTDFFKLKAMKMDSPERMKLEESLREVRLFYNDSAYYMAKSIFSHFEYFSISDLKVTKPKSLLLTARLLNSPDDDELVFEFQGLIDRVFNRTKQCLEATVHFYNTNLVDVFSLGEYEKGQFALSDKFFFDEVITKHISYIDDFRLAIGNSSILIEQDHQEYIRVTEIANTYLIAMIGEYLYLFDTLTKQVKQRNSSAAFFDTNLEKTQGAFKILYEKIHGIHSGKYLPFTAISTKS